MAEKYAVRNIRLCTKDCLCLYVCPTVKSKLLCNFLGLKYLKPSKHKHVNL